MRMAHAILTYLKQNGVDFIFGVPAGTVSPIFDAMNDVDIKPIITKNEAGAAYMAARYASVSRKLGVCIGAGGVGTNNMVNGVADAMRSKSPVLMLTGYVHRWQIGKGAIQELDTRNILKPITKYSETILDEKNVLSELEKAIKIALTPPQGPVHLSIPIDIQMCSIEEKIPVRIGDMSRYINLDSETLNNACKAIDQEKYGLIMIGKGCRNMSDLVMKLSEHLQWPIITTPEGKGVVYTDYPLNLGNYGFASTDAAANFVEGGLATCLLILGTSLGEASTCNFNKVLVNGRKIIHVDWDSKELGKVFDTDIKIHSDLRLVIPQLISNTVKKTGNFMKPVLNSPVYNSGIKLSLRLFLEKLPDILPQDTFYVSDIGGYINFVFKYLPIPKGGDFEINLNYAAMGSGIAGAIGVQAAVGNRPVAVFTGDGSYFMNGMEILTAKEYKLPIMYFIINNAMLGYVEHGHQFLYGRVVEGFRQARTNISEMVKACGVKSIQIEDIKEMNRIRDYVSHMDGPCVIELVTDGSEPTPTLDRLKALKVGK